MQSESSQPKNSATRRKSLKQRMFMEWFEAVDLVRPYVVQISTPRCSGTGFFVSTSATADYCAVATAAHVVGDSNWWEEPIRLFHPSSGTYCILRHGEHAIHFDYPRDTAAIVMRKGHIPFPDEPLELSPEGKFLRLGAEVGWLGFPAVASATMCFFGGKVSAWVEEQSAYFIDGVAINGVSGGPTFTITNSGPPRVNLIGVVSAYIPNVATGDTLPGLSVVKGVHQFQELARRFRSFDEAALSQEPLPPEGEHVLSRVRA